MAYELNMTADPNYVQQLIDIEALAREMRNRQREYFKAACHEERMKLLIPAKNAEGKLDRALRMIKAYRENPTLL